MRRKAPLIITGLVLIAGLAYWQTRTHTVAVAEPESVMTVSVVQPQRRTLSQKIHASGLVVAREDVVVTAEMTGVRLTNIFVDEGKWVKQGQPLAQLDAASVRNQFAQLDAQFKQAEQNFQRVDRIKKTGAVSLSDVEEKRTVYEAAKAQRNDALLKVKLTTLTAPAAGLVYSREANIGGMVNGNEPLFRIARDGNVELEALVSEADKTSLKVGQSTTVTVANHTAPITGKIRLISPRVDNATRSTRLRISLPKGDGISIGSFGETDIATTTTTGLALPQTAINLIDGKPTIWVIGADQKVTPVQVTLNVRDGDAVMIQSDAITQDTQIVAKAGAFLHAGDRISIATVAEPAK